MNDGGLESTTRLSHRQERPEFAQVVTLIPTELDVSYENRTEKPQCLDWSA